MLNLLRAMLTERQIIIPEQSLIRLVRFIETYLFDLFDIVDIERTGGTRWHFSFLKINQRTGNPRRRFYIHINQYRTLNNELFLSRLSVDGLQGELIEFAGTLTIRQQNPNESQIIKSDLRTDEGWQQFRAIIQGRSRFFRGNA